MTNLVAVVLVMTATQPNPSVSFIVPSNAPAIFQFQSSPDLTNWQTVVTLTNQHAGTPSLWAVGVVTTNQFFRLRFTSGKP